MRRLKIMLVAGEASGDALGADLMRAARALAGDTIEFVGVGGPLMEAEGLRSLFPMSILSVMGLFEIAPRALTILSKLKETERFAREARPDLILTIDSPGFNKRLIRRLQDLSTVRVHYVAPSVWAWRPGRAKTMAGLFDHLLALLPIEPPYFEAEGLATTFVGHPAVQAEARYQGDPRAFRRQLGIPFHVPLIAVFFGSRKGEVSRLGPVYIQALRRLSRDVPEAHVVSPAVPHLTEDVRRLLDGLPLAHSVVGQAEKMDVFHSAEVALATSGTVALETGLAGLPTVVAYRMNPMTAALARRLIRIPYANLINILLDKPCVPELLQEDCNPDRIAATVLDLIRQPDLRDAQVEAGKLVRDMLKPKQLWPSAKAARVILNLAGRDRGDRE